MRRGGIIHAAFHRFNTLGLSFSPANDEFLGYKSIYQRGSIVVPYDSSPWSRVENPFHFGFRIESLLAYIVAHIPKTCLFPLANCYINSRPLLRFSRILRPVRKFVKFSSTKIKRIFRRNFLRKKTIQRNKYRDTCISIRFSFLLKIISITRSLFFYFTLILRIHELPTTKRVVKLLASWRINVIRGKGRRREVSIWIWWNAQMPMRVLKWNTGGNKIIRKPLHVTCNNAKVH